MTLYYILLAVTGLYIVALIVNLARGVDIAVPLVFVLVHIATLMGMDCTAFRVMIEG